MKKFSCLALVIFMVLGCASMGTVHHSETIDTDAQGAVGSYRDVRSGDFTSYYCGFIGSGWAPVGGGGLGGFAMAVQPPPTQSNPMDFARSVAMINYSKKLKSIRYDEAGDVIDYDFDGRPAPAGGYKPTEAKPLPKAFGRQSVK